MTNLVKENVYGIKHHSNRGRKIYCQLCRHLYRPVWLSLFCLVILLTIFNLFISLHLINFVSFTGDSDKTWVNVTSNKANTSLPLNKRRVDSNISSNITKIRILEGTGRYDNSRKYIIHDFVYRGDNWVTLPASQQVTLATQTSVEHLFRLPEIAQFWLGLVSVAVFVPGEDYHIAALYFELLTRCFTSVKQNISVHFVYPAHRPPREILSISTWIGTCSKWSSSIKELLQHRPRDMYRWRLNLIYPQNHLRNVARKGCHTPFVYLIDVDIIPRYSLAADLNIFLRHPSCEHCAFVVPTYEINEYAQQLPSNKSSLVQLIKKNHSQPFHKSIFIHNQFATNSSIWESLPEGSGIAVAYPVTNFEMFYEPFYVARDDVPTHDERFVGYGFTRNTQVYEMHVAGYKFVVLNYAFALHRGLKKIKKKDPWREKQNRHNSLLFKAFKKEIHVKYEYNKKT
ncbi:hypothetical protein CHUAL_013751 [Chamberlinius hualienensis]